MDTVDCGLYDPVRSLAREKNQLYNFLNNHRSARFKSGLVWYREQFITLESYLRMIWDISFTDCTYNTRAPLAVQFHYIFNQCFCPMSSSTDDADELNMKVQPPQNGSNMGIQPKAFVFCICYFLVSRFVFCKAL